MTTSEVLHAIFTLESSYFRNSPIEQVWRTARGFDGGQRTPVMRLMITAKEIHESSRDIFTDAGHQRRNASEFLKTDK